MRTPARRASPSRFVIAPPISSRPGSSWASRTWPPTQPLRLDERDPVPALGRDRRRLEPAGPPPMTSTSRATAAGAWRANPRLAARGNSRSRPLSGNWMHEIG